MLSSLAAVVAVTVDDGGSAGRITPEGLVTGNKRRRRRPLDGHQTQILQPVVDGDAVLVDHVESRSYTTAVPLPVKEEEEMSTIIESSFCPFSSVQRIPR